MSAKPRFVHLRTHTDFSMIDGIVKVKPLVKACAANNMVALALTDFTNFCGVVRFYGETLSSGIKPIIGADVHVKSELCGEELFTLTLLAKNNEGYKNITLLLSKAYQRGYVDLPYIDQEWLIEHREGVIVLSGGTQGDIAKKLLKENISEAESAVSFYQEFFPDYFYLSLSRTGRPDEERYIQAALKLAEEHDLPLVATNDVVLSLIHI